MASLITFAVLGEATFNRLRKGGCGCWVAALTSRPSKRPVRTRYVVPAVGWATLRPIAHEMLSTLCH